MTRVVLDWRGHEVAKKPGRCRHAARCLFAERDDAGLLRGGPALMRDEQGRPCHKVCAEAAIERAAARHGQADGQPARLLQTDEASGQDAVGPSAGTRRRTAARRRAGART